MKTTFPHNRGRAAMIDDGVPGLDANTRLFLSCDETPGSVPVDHSTDGADSPHTATAIGGAVTAAARGTSPPFTNALDLNVETRWLEFADSDDFQFGAEHTIEMWGYLERDFDGANQYFWCIHADSEPPATRQSYGSGFWVDGEPQGSMRIGSTYEYNVRNAPGSEFPFEDWTHVAYQRRVVATVPRLEMFLDGTLVATLNNATGTFPNPLSVPLIIGSSGITGQTFVGQIARVVMYDGALYSGNFTPSTVLP